MEGHSQRPSPALLAAQQRLVQLRTAYQPAASRCVEVASVLAVEASSDALCHQAQALLLARRRQEAALQTAPSDALLAYRPPRPLSPWTIQRSSDDTPDEPAQPSLRLPARVVKVYPGILLGMLDRRLEAPGRVWLLLQYLDEKGSGRLTVEAARQQLTGPDSELRICNWRNLRGLLQRGEGIFWQRDGAGCIWLRGAGKVAVTLAAGRLQGRPVELPLTALLGGVGGLRAHFYASFHSGRKNSTPISRTTLEKLTHVPARTQRTYERRTGVTNQPNVAVGEAYTTQKMQERAWQHGRAVFVWIDYRGRQGPPNYAYIAWRLPNSYTGCHAQRPKGRQRKINRQIDLVKTVAQGNGRPVRRLFYRNGAAAGKGYNRNVGHDTYWPDGTAINGTRARRWQVIPTTQPGKK